MKTTTIILLAVGGYAAFRIYKDHRRKQNVRTQAGAKSVITQARELGGLPVFGAANTVPADLGNEFGPSPVSPTMPSDGIAAISGEDTPPATSSDPVDRVDPRSFLGAQEAGASFENPTDPRKSLFGGDTTSRYTSFPTLMA